MTELHAIRPDARVLRAEGKVAGKRPEFALAHVPIEIRGISLNEAPKPPVDAVLILGMGPVDPILVGVDGKRRVGIKKSRMINNAVAAVELSAHGLVKKDGVVVPSGTATADPAAVEAALMQKTASPREREAFVQSLGSIAATLSSDEINRRFTESIREFPTLQEAEEIYKTTEAELMGRLYSLAHPKGSIDINGEGLGIQVRPDNEATETADNYINLLNDLDEQSRKEKGVLFEGNIAAVTARYHIARTMEIARFLGIGDRVVPLVSQEVLKAYGYNPDRLMSKEDTIFDETTRWNEQKWIRTLHQMPEYFLPVLAQIRDNERFMRTLKHVRGIYGTSVFARHDLLDIDNQNADDIRARLRGITRTNPLEEDWLKTDTQEVNTAIDSYVRFTNEWITTNTPNHTPLPQHIVDSVQR